MIQGDPNNTSEMRVYNQGVRVLIHYGPSRNIETYHHYDHKNQWQGKKKHT